MATAIPVWANPLTEPKRRYKFILNIAGIPAYVVKTTDRPQVSVGEAQHEFLVHNFYFPGRVTWNEINVSLVDPIDPDVSKRLLDLVKNAGYVNPSDFSGNPNDPGYLRKSIGKAGFIDQLGQVTIDTLNTAGETIETWRLNNVFVRSVTYNQMNYSDEGLIELGLQLRYDWAELETFSPTE
jgi:hypothetical protein